MTSIFSQDAELARLKELCAMQPDDPAFFEQLANRLMDAGHELLAIDYARRAYRLYVQESEVGAQRIRDTFGDEVQTSEIKPVVYGDYRALAKVFGYFAMKRREVRLREGEVLLRTGEDADLIYLVLSGELAVSNETNGQLSLLNYVYAGALLGEAALEQGAKRNATVIAHTKAKVLRFEPDELREAFSQYPELHQRFLKEINLRQCVVRMSSVTSFACLPVDIRFMLAQRARKKNYRKGQIIKRAYEYMPDVELITQGTVALYQQHESETPVYCGRLVAGDVLGLHKIMDGKVSDMMFVAQMDCEMVCMDFALVEDAMEISPDFRQKLRNNAGHTATRVTRTVILHNSLLDDF